VREEAQRIDGRLEGTLRVPEAEPRAIVVIAHPLPTHAQSADRLHRSRVRGARLVRAQVQLPRRRRQRGDVDGWPR
jgi:hypothetical protein